MDDRGEYLKKWAAEHAEHLREYKRQYYLRNRERLLQKQRSHYYENSDLVKNYQKEYRKEKKATVLSACIKRKADQSKRYAKWERELTRFVSEEAFDLARIRKNVTGFSWHVDHMIPMHGKLVSGLHVWNNLAVVPAIFNLRKNRNSACETTFGWLA